MGVTGYLEIAEVVRNEDKVNIIQCIEEHGYSYGYATFWHANVITELTDGQISFRNLKYNSDTGALTKFYWLEPVADVPPNVPVIGVFEKYEIAQTEFLNTPQVVYEDEIYVVLEFTSREELEMAFGL